MSDWLSTTWISNGWFLPSPSTRPSAVAAFHLLTQYWPASPNAARTPVSGSTKPTLTGRPASTPAVVVVLAAAVVVVAGAAVVVVAGAALVVVVVAWLPQAATRPPRPAPTPIVAPAIPAIFRNSRRLTLLPSSLIANPLQVRDPCACDSFCDPHALQYESRLTPDPPMCQEMNRHETRIEPGRRVH